MYQSRENMGEGCAKSLSLKRDHHYYGGEEDPVSAVGWDGVCDWSQHFINKCTWCLTLLVLIKP